MSAEIEYRLRIATEDGEEARRLREALRGSDTFDVSRLKMLPKEEGRVDV